MRYAHIADCHIGSWRDPKLKDISTRAFLKAVDTCINHPVDFILISGDLFNTALPSIDNLKSVVLKLKQLKDKDIKVYCVPGSHDFSASGKTMLDVLEHADLLINVSKGKIENKRLVLNFTIDPKTGAKITGMIGKKGMLERSFYEQLERENLEKEQGYKIFLFHTAISELKPKNLEKMDSAPLSLLPKGFDYYAGGHVHYIFQKHEPEYGMIAFPGALFPNNFSELEKFGRGGFYIIEHTDEKDDIEWHPIQIYNTHHINLDCGSMTPEQVNEELMHQIKDKEFINTIITIRLKGKLTKGRASDIDFKMIYETLYNKSAFYVMKNTSALTSEEFQDVNIRAESTEEIENTLIKENVGQIKVEGMNIEKEESLTHDLIRSLSSEKEEGERVVDFERRIVEDVEKILDIE